MALSLSTEVGHGTVPIHFGTTDPGWRGEIPAGLFLQEDPQIGP